MSWESSFQSNSGTYFLTEILLPTDQPTKLRIPANLYTCSGVFIHPSVKSEVA